MNEKDDIIELDLKQLLIALMKKGWIILLCGIFGGVLSLLITINFMTPMYQADVSIYVNNSSISLGSTALSISGSELSAAQTLVDTYIVILHTRTMLEDVIEELGLPYTYDALYEMISASAVNGTEIFKVTVNSPDAQEAMDIANTIAYLLPTKIANIVDGSSVRVVDYAVEATDPYAPATTTNVLIGILLGLLLCAMVIVLQTVVNETIDSEEYIAQSFQYPILTIVPDVTQETSSGGYYTKMRPSNQGNRVSGGSKTKKGGV